MMPVTDNAAAAEVNNKGGDDHYSDEEQLLEKLRFESQQRLANRWEEICEKYSRAFDGEADIVDLAEERIIEDNGFLRRLDSVQMIGGPQGEDVIDDEPVQADDNDEDDFNFVGTIDEILSGGEPDEDEAGVGYGAFMSGPEYLSGADEDPLDGRLARYARLLLYGESDTGPEHAATTASTDETCDSSSRCGPSEQSTLLAVLADGNPGQKTDVSSDEAACVDSGPECFEGNAAAQAVADAVHANKARPESPTADSETNSNHRNDNCTIVVPPEDYKENYYIGRDRNLIAVTGAQAKRARFN